MSRAHGCRSSAGSGWLGYAPYAFLGVLACINSAHAAPVTDPASGHSYEVIQQGKTWSEAQDAAEAMSTTLRSCHLAAITSQAENDFVIANLINPLGPPDPNDSDDTIDVWIGAERDSSEPCDPNNPDGPTKWGEWVTGEAWAFTDWRSGEPDDCDEDCALYARDQQPPKWENEYCNADDPDSEDEEIWYLVECDPLKVVDPNTNHSYQVIKKETATSWEEARAAAEAMSSSTQTCHLATITSQAENDFLVSNLIPGIPGGEDLWIGGMQRLPCIGGNQNDRSLWGVWVTGEPWVYTNWAESEPDDTDSDGVCPLGCLTYGNEEAPPAWEDAGCANDEISGCLVECEPEVAVPTISREALAVLCLLALVLAWRGMKRRDATE